MHVSVNLADPGIPCSISEKDKCEQLQDPLKTCFALDATDVSFYTEMTGLK
jgi:hypothetical protein